MQFRGSGGSLWRQPEELVRQIQRGGHTGVLAQAAATLIVVGFVEKAVVQCHAQFTITDSDIKVTAWLSDGSISVENVIGVRVEGVDGWGTDIALTFTVREFSVGKLRIAVSGTALEIDARYSEDVQAGHESELRLTLTLPVGLAYPFSSVKKEVLEADGLELAASSGFSGFYGASPVLQLAIHESPDFAMAVCVHPIKSQSQHAVDSLKYLDAFQQAMEYVVGFALRARFSSVTARGVTRVVVRAQGSSSPLGQGGSPVDLRLGKAQFLSAFQDFFLYGVDRSPEQQFSLYRVVHDVYGTFETYITVQLLHLCIAVEALVREVESGSSEHEFSQSELRSIRRLLRRCALTDQKKNRLSGVLSMANNPSTKIRMDRLVNKGILRGEHLVAWKRNRNAYAHGETMKTSVEAMVIDRNQLLDGFHRLTKYFLKLRAS